MNAELARLASKTRQRLVRISNGREGHGAGLVWNADGLIVTNAHVVRLESPKVILHDGRTLPASVLAHDPERDLALLSVEATDLPTVEPGESKNVRAGQLVFAFGHPWGVVGAATAGVVIGAGPDLPEMRRGAREWIMVSLRLRPGNSGGPLVDAQGRLLGVNTIMTGPEVGGAVPVHVAQSFVWEALLH
jgi:serine protease Do